MSKKREFLVKSNSLITSRYKLNIVEQKILCKIITMIHINDTDFKDYSIKKTELISLIGKNQNLYSNIKKYTENLLKRPITIIDHIDNETVQTNWFSLIRHKNDGSIVFNFHPYLKKYLIQLKTCFTSFDYENIQKLQSKYSPRIYELLKQYEKIGERIIMVDKLRELFFIESKYKKYTDFKKNVLEVPQKEINLHTDISFSFEEIKVGKKVSSIKFDISSKKTYYSNIGQVEDTINFIQANNESINDPQTELIAKKVSSIIDDSISKATIEELVKEHGIECINYHLDNWHKFSNVNMKSKSGFFIACVKKNYIPSEQQIGKPIQTRNYEQRQCDDEDWEAYYWTPEQG